jgi:hypothetical protein
VLTLRQTEMAIVASEKSSRQLCRHILPIADMEATSDIRYLLALGAVWNIHLHDYPGANALLSNAVCRDECHFPFDARPTVGAVRLPVPIVKAGSCEE